jgi:hypothetical protein
MPANSTGWTEVGGCDGGKPLVRATPPAPTRHLSLLDEIQERRLDRTRTETQPHPMNRLLVILLAAGLCQGAETLRISAVVESDSPDAERMTYKTAEDEQGVWVSNKAIITEKDVKDACQFPGQEKTISVRLTEKGADAMIAAASPIRSGFDRLAIIIEGRLHSAPVERREFLRYRYQ